jgi:chromosomal replication initiation ATPase DnaA
MKTPEELAGLVERATGYGPAALRSQERTSKPVTARMLFCYMARREGYSFPVAGKFIRHNHSTILQAARTFEA